MSVERGMIARSLAGHDKGSLYIIDQIEGGYVYLTDGRSRTIDRPKKKKLKHVQITQRIPDELLETAKLQEPFQNETIKRVIGGMLHVKS